YVAAYITPLVRPCLDARRGDFAVTDYAIGSRVEEAGRHRGWAADVFMAEVSQPDDEGRVGFGYGPWHAKALLAAAKLSIAEVGQGVFRARGDASVARARGGAGPGWRRAPDRDGHAVGADGQLTPAQARSRRRLRDPGPVGDRAGQVRHGDGTLQDLSPRRRDRLVRGARRGHGV